MPRKGLRPRDRRPLPAPDYKYNSVLVARFINKLNFEGKTATAERILDDAMAIIAEKTKENAREKTPARMREKQDRIHNRSHTVEPVSQPTRWHTKRNNSGVGRQGGGGKPDLPFVGKSGSSDLIRRR